MLIVIKALGIFVLCTWIVMVVSNMYYHAFVRNRDVDARIEHWMETHGLIALHFAIQNHLLRIVLVYTRIRIVMWNMLNRCVKWVIGGDDDV